MGVQIDQDQGQGPGPPRTKGLPSPQEAPTPGQRAGLQVVNAPSLFGQPGRWGPHAGSPAPAGFSQDFLGSPFQTSFLHLWAHPPPWDPQGQGPWGRGPLVVGTVPGLSGTACLLRAWLAADGSTQECSVGGGIPASLPRRVLRPPAASCCPSRRTELSISGSWSWQGKHRAPT